MLKKLLAILLISVLSITSVKADEMVDMINTLVERLEESTIVIEELAQANSVLSQENADLRFQLSEYQGTDVAAMTQERNQLVEVIDNLTIRLEESTSVIEDLVLQIETDQEEIIALRNGILNIIGNYENSSLYNLQLGATFPLGLQVAIDFRIPRLPIGLYATSGIMTDESQIQDITGIKIYVGGGIRFGL